MTTNGYTTFVGRSKRKRAATGKKLYTLPIRECPDDGKTLLHAGDWNAKCPDCALGKLRWAEAGYVPWHRICDCCGSHWDLHPVQLAVDRDGEVRPVCEASAWEPPSEDGPIGGTVGAPTYGLLLMLVTEQMVNEARQKAGQFAVPMIEACWARRARLYK
jgi:hypothetical protein